jgi:hypothetical protein
MLVIRAEQMQVLEEIAAQNFENELVEHLKNFAPKHSEVIKDSGVRQVVWLGIDRAKKYDFTNRGPVRFYVEMMFMFGSDFDTDIQLPWAGAALKTDSVADQMERADLLYDKMLMYLEQVSGADDDYFVNSLHRLNKTNIEDYAPAGGNFQTKIVAALRSIYPQKCEYLGEQQLHTLAQRGKELAGEYSVTSEKGVAIFTALMFTLGHGFAADPLFPWISKTLKDETVIDPNERVEKIYKKTKIYLEKVIRYLE